MEFWIDNQELRLRDYSASDFESCSELLRLNTPKFFAAEESKDYRSFLKKSSNLYWVIQLSKGKMIAAGGIHVGKDGEGSICWTLVHPSYRGKQIGSFLVAHCLQRLVQVHRVSKITLNTSQHTESFFSGFGFESTKITNNFFGPGLHRHDMELDGNSNLLLKKIESILRNARPTA